MEDRRYPEAGWMGVVFIISILILGAAAILVHAGLFSDRAEASGVDPQAAEELRAWFTQTGVELTRLREVIRQHESDAADIYTKYPKMPQAQWLPSDGQRYGEERARIVSYKLEYNRLATQYNSRMKEIGSRFAAENGLLPAYELYKNW